MAKLKVLRGAKAIDAEDKLILNIKPEDIAGSTPLDPFNCAAARSIKRTCKVKEAIVMRSATYINYGTKKAPEWVRSKTPTSISREITAFDRGAKFAPGIYTFSPYPPSVRFGVKSRKRPSGGKGKGALKHVTANIREA